MKTMKDAAWPTAAGPITDIMLIYSGGDTPHPWSVSDIASMPERYRLPCWVRSNPAGFSGAVEAATFAAWLHGHGVPSGVAVVLDLETAVDTAYVNGFNLGMRAAGFKTMKYGSTSTIWLNPKTDGGTFVADPTGVPHMDTTGDTVATQYAFDGSYDLSWVLDSVPLWDTKSNKPPSGGTVDVTLPILQQGSTGGSVSSAQVLLNKFGERLTVDGVFGPATKNSTQTLQSRWGLLVDGIWGHDTWTAALNR
jgi:hypothetical protein